MTLEWTGPVRGYWLSHWTTRARTVVLSIADQGTLLP
jgi:hypothetical protein